MSTTSPMTFDVKLWVARECKDAWLSEVSQSTKISNTILAAVETNDTDAVPGGVVIRSFVRNLRL